MSKQRNSPRIPNNPMLAYQAGRLQGCKETMDMVGMVLLDKMGFHASDLGEDAHDQQSLQYFWACLCRYREMIDKGEIRYRDFAAVLAEDYGVYYDT